MRPTNLGFEECNVEAIYRDLDKNTQTSRTNRNDSANNSIKSSNLSVPPDLDPKLVKVFSNCNKECSDKSCEGLTSPMQGNFNNKDECKSSSKCSCSNHSSAISNNDNCRCSSGLSKLLPVNKNNTNDCNTKLKQDKDSMTVKLNIEQVPKEPSKNLDQKISCVTVFIDKSLYEDYKGLFDQKSSERQINKSSSDSKCSESLKKKCSCKHLPAERPDKHLKEMFDKFVNKVCSHMKFESNTSVSNNSNRCQKETSKSLETNKISDKDDCKEKGQEEQSENYVLIKKISKRDVLDRDSSKSKNECQDLCKKNFDKHQNANVQDKCSKDNKTVEKSRSCDCSKCFSKDIDKNQSHKDLNKSQSLEQFSNKCSRTSVLVKKESPRKDICVDRDLKKKDEECHKTQSSNTLANPGLCGKKPVIKCPKRKQSFEDFCKESKCNDVLKCMKEKCEELEKKGSKIKKPPKCGSPEEKQSCKKNDEAIKSPKKYIDSQCSLQSSTSRSCLQVPYEQRSGCKNSCNENIPKKKSCKDVVNDIIEDEQRWTEFLKIIQQESEEELCKEYDEYLKTETDSPSDFENSGWSRMLSHDLAYISLDESEPDLSKNIPESVHRLINKLENRSAQFHLPIPGTSPLKLNSNENIWNNCLSMLPVSGKISKGDIEISTSDAITTNMPSECGGKISFTNPNIVKNRSDTEKSVTTDFASKSLEDKENESSYSFITAALKIGLKSERSYPKFVTNLKDKATIESLSAAHNQTVATLKTAVQDIADKVYTTTAGAITRIHSESSRHIDIIKNYNKSEDSELNREKIETFFKECINKINEQDVRSAVSSTRSLLKETCTRNLPCINDSSSVYDVPDSNLQDISLQNNSIDVKTSITSTIFWYIKNKLFPFFNKSKVEDSSSSTTIVAPRPSNTSNITEDMEENITEDVEENIDENDSISDDDIIE